MSTNRKSTESVRRWFLVWTAIGCVFALQLRWYYELTWSLSIFWGLADWYLWGMLALPAGKAIGRLKNSGAGPHLRVIVYALLAPVIAALHVVLTMLVGGIGIFSAETPWIEYFEALYAKKLMLNLITCAAIVVAYERLSRTCPRRDRVFLAKLGDVSRLVSADEIISGEVCGNYVNLHTRDGVWPLRETLTGLLDRLPAEEFVRVSRSAMVSLKRIREQCSDQGALTLLLDNGVKVQVSRRYRPQVRQALKEHCKNGQGS